MSSSATEKDACTFSSNIKKHLGINALSHAKQIRDMISLAAVYMHKNTKLLRDHAI